MYVVLKKEVQKTLVILLQTKKENAKKPVRCFLRAFLRTIILNQFKLIFFLKND